MASSAAKRGLGTGLSALFGDSPPEKDADVRSLPISKVEPRENQPRAYFDEVALGELAESIRQYGLIQPITVRKLASGYYQIVAGERRWRASRIAGLTEIPVRVIEADERLATELALVENLQREDLNPVEEARGYRSLMKEYDLTQDEAAQRVGKARPTVTNSLRLLNLSEDVLLLIEHNVLSAGHGRALVPVQPESLQLEAAKAVLKDGLSVRKTEELAKKLMREPKIALFDKPDGIDYLGEVAKKLERTLGRRVIMTENGKRGRITIEYYGSDDREQLIDALDTLKSACKE